MEVNHHKENRISNSSDDGYAPGPRLVDITEIIFDELDQELAYADFYVKGRGHINDYLRVYGPGRIVIDGTITQEEVFETIELGKRRERHIHYKDIISPLLNYVPDTIVKDAQPIKPL